MGQAQYFGSDNMAVLFDSFLYTSLLSGLKSRAKTERFKRGRFCFSRRVPTLASAFLLHFSHWFEFS